MSTPIKDVNEVFNALEKWINRRPGLDSRDYDCTRPEGRAAYRSELRDIGKDRKRALAALDGARGLDPKPELLAEAFRAFSGRLEWNPGESIDTSCRACVGFTSSLGPVDHYANCKTRGALHYTTGQYFPTEYRKAAASVLESYISAWRQAENAAKLRVFTYQTMADVRAANISIGHHWFDRSSMRGFGTKIESGLIAGKRFITSERGSHQDRKRYTVREARPDGTIETVSDFQEFSTITQAKARVMMNKAARSNA